MTLMDAKCEVVCDGKGCRESFYVDLPAGPRSSYLCHDSDIERAVEAEGWKSDDDTHYCENCAEEREDR